MPADHVADANQPVCPDRRDQKQQVGIMRSREVTAPPGRLSVIFLRWRCHPHRALQPVSQPPVGTKGTLTPGGELQSSLNNEQDDLQTIKRKMTLIKEKMDYLAESLEKSCERALHGLGELTRRSLILASGSHVAFSSSGLITWPPPAFFLPRILEKGRMREIRFPGNHPSTVPAPHALSSDTLGWPHTT